MVSPVRISFTLALLASGCIDPGAGTADTATLRVRVEPDSARVSIDDRYVARARSLDTTPRAIEAGEHFLTIEADGYFPHDLAVDLPPGETTVEVRLRPIPP